MWRACSFLVVSSFSGLAIAQDAPPAEDLVAEDPADETARIHFEAGRVHYDRGAYEDAVREFEAAYAADPRPELLFNLYSANERAGNAAAAAEYLTRYLAEGEIGEERATLEARLENLRRRLDADEEPAPEPEPAPTPPPRPAPPPSGGGIGAPAIASFIAGGVGLVAFGVFAALAAAEDARLSTDCGIDVGGFCSDDEIASLRVYTIVADVGLGVGVLGAALGLVFALAGVGASGTEAQAHLAPWAAPTGAGLLAEVELR